MSQEIEISPVIVYALVGDRVGNRNEMSFGESAEGGLHKYANPVLIEQEKDAWRREAVKKHGRE